MRARILIEQRANDILSFASIGCVTNTLSALQLSSSKLIVEQRNDLLLRISREIRATIRLKLIRSDSLIRIVKCRISRKISMYMQRYDQ